MSSSNNITPDRPEMRSVMLRPLTELPAPRTLISEKSQVVRSEKSQLDFQQREIQRAKQWNPKNVSPLPTAHPLERTHVYIENASHQQVSNRLAESLRVQSVVAQFDEVRTAKKSMAVPSPFVRLAAPAKKIALTHCLLLQSLARCETREHVKFIIRIFTADDRVVVEIQRLSGCCYIFHQAAKNLLKAALGQEAVPCMELTIPPVIMSESEEREATKEALDIAWTMLQSCRFDCRLLAMESLASLTKTNSAAAKAVVNGPLLTNLLHWIVFDGVEDQFVDRQDYSTKMHRYALVVLANCLTSLTLYDIPPVSDECLNSLIKEVREADFRPHNACEAAKSLKALVRCDDVRTRALNMGASEALNEAYKLGKSQHMQLENESLSLQIEMGN